MRLDVKACGLAGGILCGAAVCLATLWLIAFGYKGELMGRLDHFYIGYSFSVVGAFVGLIWGFIDGFIGGVIFAWLYNKFAKA